MVAFVQQASATGNTVTVTLGANTTAGNCLVACISLGSGGSLASVTSVKLGGSADNWTQLFAVGDLTTGAEQLALWVDPNCAGGQTSIVMQPNVANTNCMYVFEFSGVVTSSPLDQHATFDSGGGNNASFSVTTGTTTQATEVAVACVYGFNQTITGPSSPWVNESTIGASRNLQASYNILSSTGTVTYSGSFSGSTFNGQICVTLKGTGGAAAPNGTVQPLAVPAVMPRRPPVRGLTGFVPVATINTGHGPAGTVQPAATFPTPRRRPSRVVTGFTPVRTFNTGHGPAGTVQPLAVPAVMPRRRPARSSVQFVPVKTTNNLTPVVTPPTPPPLGGGKSMLARFMRWADL